MSEYIQREVWVTFRGRTWPGTFLRLVSKGENKGQCVCRIGHGDKTKQVTVPPSAVEDRVARSLDDQDAQELDYWRTVAQRLAAFVLATAEQECDLASVSSARKSRHKELCKEALTMMRREMALSDRRLSKQKCPVRALQEFLSRAGS